MPIKVENLSFTYLLKTENAFKALDGVSFEIKENSITGIIGHTGSGKSTLVQMLNGLLLPQQGKVTVNDFIVTGGDKKIKNVKGLRKTVGLVFQFPEYQLFEETIEKDVAFGPKNFGAKDDEAIQKAHEALALMGLDESFYKRSPFELSGGEKRKVALAGILALDSEVLILDEPTAGLDPKSAFEVMNLVMNLHSKGKTIIIITHDMDLLFRYCDHAILLKNGKIEFDGKPRDLFKTNLNDLSIDVPKLYQFLSILESKGIEVDYDKIRSLDDLIKFISERRVKHE